MSRPGMAVVTVRFYVGEDREDSLIKLYNKVAMNIDVVPPGVTGWVIKPIEIDDVPIVNVTLWSRRYDDAQLRRMAEQVEIALQSVPNTARTEVVGGRRRQVVVQLDPERLSAHGITPLEVAGVLRGANVNRASGGFSRDNREIIVESGPYLRDAREIGRLVVGVYSGNPVYLGDVAAIRDGPEEPSSYTRISFGQAQPVEQAEAAGAPGPADLGKDFPAVTVAVAKRKGSNAVWVARGLEQKLEELRQHVIPTDVEMQITHNTGETANEKVNELINELGIAIIIVVGLIAYTLGWREAIIVVTAVPLTFALTLLVNYLAGYSINRVTLFALILALGLVVDDPIVDVENIFRHFAMRNEPPRQAVLTAVNEVRPPIIVATLVVIISFLPMFFITGMMGPYMRPMALNVPVAMLMSMVVAFTVTPWLSYHVLKSQYGKEAHAFELEKTLTYRVYKAIVSPFLASRALAWLLIFTMIGLLVASSLLPATGRVPLKMLPFDNKNEFQIVVDMPRGTTVEATDATLRDLVRAAADRAGGHAGAHFCRHGLADRFQRNGAALLSARRSPRGRHPGQPAAQGGPAAAEPRDPLAAPQRPDDDRAEPRREHQAGRSAAGPAGAGDFGGRDLRATEPELPRDHRGVAARRRLLESEPGVVDVDAMVEADQTKFIFSVDKEKASLHGVSTDTIAATIRLALDGMMPGQDAPGSSGAGTLHLDRELNPLTILLRLPRPERSSRVDLARLSVKGAGGELVQIAELGHFEETAQDQTIYHKNLQRVVYVYGDVAGRPPAEVILSLGSRLARDPFPAGTRGEWAGEGEWKITLDVFRDLGIAFGGAVIGIYILLVWQTGSFSMPLVRMISIPLTIIGIMPGFWLLNELWNQPIGGYPNPVYFTATAMIGMIALAGIADRNAILLIDFIHTVLERGGDLRRALIESGAVRFRPIFLTAGAAMLGAWPITLDPVFSGLAWSLIFGLVVSTAFTLILVPVVYWMLYANDPHHGLAAPEEDALAQVPG